MPAPIDRLRRALGDRYAPEEQVGEGAAALVFRAEDRKHHRRVALKVLRPEMAAALGAERFLREIELAAKLSHPHILTLIDSGTADGLLYYVMPFVEGGSLRVRLDAAPRIGIDEAVGIARAVAGALDYAHRHGVVHRDIKPENILLHDAVPVVADFGIAAALTVAGGERLTATGIAVGTPAYMSPEQVVGDNRLDGRSDIYSLGCVLYEMLAGRPPFDAPTTQQVIGRRLTEPPPRVTRERDEAPPAVEAAICRAMAREAGDRFLTAAEFSMALAAPYPAGVARTGATPATKTIAVLPFANVSADPDNEYFSDGITDELISTLGRIPGLRVTARTSAFAFKGAVGDVREIGRKLNVGVILEGSVRRAGTRVRLSTQLVDVASGHPLWSERFDRELADIFAVQDELAGAIARRLEVELRPSGGRASPPATASLEAYDEYLRGRFQWNAGTADGYRRCLEHFDRAVELDAGFAQAHLAIAIALVNAALVGTVSATEAGRRGRAAIEAALAADPDLPEAQYFLALIEFWFERNWEAAERHFKRGVQLDAGSVPGRSGYSAFLSNLGRPEEAIEHAQVVVARDPLWANGRQTLQWALFQAGRYDESLAEGRRASELAPGYALANVVSGFACIELGRYDDALREFDRAVKAAPGFPLALAGRVQAHARAGRRGEADANVSQMEEMSRQGALQSSALAWAYAAVGRVDDAFARVEDAVREHDVLCATLPSFSWWDPLRRDPRFEELLLKLEFPAWSLAVARRRWERAIVAPGASVSGVLPERPSVVVLPFVNLSPEPDTDYFADGLTDELIGDLSGVSGLRVISRASAMRLKARERDIPAIARELKVDYALDGSVRRAASRVRVTAQLVRAAGDEQLWTQKYDGTLDDVFDVQQSMSTAIVAALQVALTPDEAERIGTRPIANTHVLECYLRARQEIWSFTADGRQRAIQLLRNGLALAGDNALLYATLGYAHLQGYHVGTRADDTFLQEAIAYAARAIELAPDAAYGYGVSGYAHCFRGEGQLAVRELKRALAINPNDADVLFHLSWYYADAGFMAHAAPLADRLATVDPLTPISQAMPGWVALLDGRLADSLPPYERMHRMDPQSPFTRWAYALQLALNGRSVEACGLLDGVEADAPGTPFAWYGRMLACALRGDREGPLAAVTPELTGWARPQFQFSWFVAQALARVDATDLALDWLSNAFRLGFLNHRFLADYDIHLESLRKDSRFRALMVEMQERQAAFEP